ncbi:hypothetical protein D9M71_635070 [compost metagenome]
MLLDGLCHRRRLARRRDNQAATVEQRIEKRIKPTDVIEQQERNTGEPPLALLMPLKQRQCLVYAGLGRT